MREAYCGTFSKCAIFHGKSAAILGKAPQRESERDREREKQNGYTENTVAFSFSLSLDCGALQNVALSEIV